MSEYPEHDKMAAVKDRSQAIGEFLDWMPTGGYFLGQWACAGHYDPDEKHVVAEHENRDIDYWFHQRGHLDGCDRVHATMANVGIERVLAEYFDIDLRKIDVEKDQMLASIRSDA